MMYIINLLNNTLKNSLHKNQKNIFKQYTIVLNNGLKNFIIIMCQQKRNLYNI